METTQKRYSLSSKVRRIFACFQAHRSKCLLFIYLILLIIVLAIIIACMALYSESIAYTLSNMDSINKSIDIVSDGMLIKLIFHFSC